MSGRLPVRAKATAILLVAFVRHAASAAAPPVTIAIANFTFDPPALTVPAGTEVTWVNQDDIPHLVDAADGAFRSPPLDTDDRFTLRLDRAGHDQLFLRPAPAHDGDGYGRGGAVLLGNRRHLDQHPARRVVGREVADDLQILPFRGPLQVLGDPVTRRSAIQRL